MSCALSIILPVYNRVALLHHPLTSLRAAAHSAPALAWELIVVDDGSTEDVGSVLAGYSDLPIRLVRQENAGLLAARLAGLAHACGNAVCFLDGDDAVTTGKFTSQLAPLLDDRADVVYGDMGRCRIDATGRPIEPLRADPPSSEIGSPAEFYLELQPAPHDPIFRTEYLRGAISPPLMAADRQYDSIAETWFYYHLSVRPARIERVTGIWSIVGEPAGDRISRKWERQCAAALRLMRAFLRHCPDDELGMESRRLVGRCAFATWRGLPHGFPFADQLLDVWRTCPSTPHLRLGGGGFQRLAMLFGPVLAGRILRRWQRPAYRSIRTVEESELTLLFA